MPARGGTSLPIADYGLLADCSSAALLSRYGSIDWLCLPRYDSPSLFARLLDPDGGHWSIAPTGEFRPVERRYLDGTLIIESIFETASGRVRVRDAMAFAAGQRGHDLGYRPPHELLRTVEGLGGSVAMELELAPRPEYGLVRPLLRLDGDGGRTFGGPNQIAFCSGVPLEHDGATVRAAFRADAGSTIGFALRWGPPEFAPPRPTAPADVPHRMADTVAGWRSWEAEHEIDAGPYRELIRLSSRVLKGLTYRPTGAVVAAPTAGLPEAVGGERNWDYRFAWARDSALTLEALYIGACPVEAEDFVSFMTSSAGGTAAAEGSLQIMYGVTGEHDLSERTLPHLRGWRGSAPVRVGNDAWRQTQLDVYGELLNCLWLYRERLGTLHPEIQRFVAGLADAAERRWREPDAGMWEMRGAPRHHLSSKVLCWTALDRAVKLAPQLGDYANTRRWEQARDEVRDAVLARGWSEARQAYVQSFESEELDAAQLLMPLVGFLPATDERMRSTIEAIADGLTEDGLVLRYRSDEGLNADGLSGREGTFVICTCWLVCCLALAGERERAQALLGRLAGAANDLGLIAEEIDGRTGELLGNFPQAFSHVGLIIAANTIDHVPPRFAEVAAPEEQTHAK